jgi:hypothetical protein
MVSDEISAIVSINGFTRVTMNTQPLATIRRLTLEPSRAANSTPPPEPGFRAVGSLLFYVTERGRCWLVRDARGLVQFTPAVLPRDSRVVNEIMSIKLDIVAEAADLLEQHQPAGLYRASGVLYVLTERSDTWMFYRTCQTVVRVPCLPPRALSVDIPPREITAAIERMGAAG